MLHILVAFIIIIKSIHQSVLMEAPMNDTTIVLKVSEQIGDFPATVRQIEEAIKKARAVDRQLALMSQQQIRRRVIQANAKMIEWQFVDMMQRVLRKIEPEIKDYPKHKSIKYLQAIIYEHLDPKIFPPGVRISKIRTNLLGDSLDNPEITIADRLFTELITVMNQLLQIMKEYYGLPRDQKVTGVLFHCINMFVSDNQDCFLVLQDKKSEEEKSSINGQAKGDVLIDTLDQIQADKKKGEGSSKTPHKALHTAETLIGTLFTTIKYNNPFGGKKLTQKQIKQKEELLKNLQKMKKREPLDQNTIKMIQKLAAMDSTQIIMTMTKQEKTQFTTLLVDFLDESSKLKNKSKLDRMEYIEKQIAAILSSTIDFEYPPSSQQFEGKKQLKWIVLLYKALEKEYHNDSERRKWLMKFCENKPILDKIHNPFSIIKALECQNVEQSPILKALRSLPVSEKAEERKKHDWNKKKQQQAHVAIEHQLNRIHLFDLKKKYAKQPLLQFQRLTGSKRRVITLFFSGFLSEDTCKVGEWSGLLNNFYDSEVYSVRWESKTVKNMMQFAVKSISDLGPTQSIAMLGGPYIKAIAIMHHIYQKFQDNPFNPAFEAAVATGQFMAEFIMNNFKGHFVNLVGFSLGTQLIRNIMVRMAEKNCLHMINKAYFLGGVADKSLVQKLIESSPTPLTIINVYSDNDYVLKYLLRLCKSGIVPVGLNQIKQIQGHVIKNQDASFYVEGHLSYRSKLQIFGKLLKMADD